MGRNRKQKRVNVQKPRTPKKENPLKRPEVVLEPWNDKQEQCLNNLDNFKVNLILGSAGTGKTFMAASKAAELLADRDIRNIVMSKPIEGIGPSMGYLPGTLDEKMEPWYASITDVLKLQLGHGFYEAGYGKSIRIEPLQMLRGRSFPNTAILVDECQNLSKGALKAIIGRVGEGSTLTFMGDLKQIDVRDSGIQWLLRFLDDPRSGITRFVSDDIVRSSECKYWVTKMENEE